MAENPALHKCARLLFSSTDKPSRLLRDLCEHLVDIPGNTLPLAAAAALVDGFPSSAVAVGPLISQASFLSLQGNSEICLNVEGMLEQGRKLTSTGTLFEELPAPVGYVNGKHPVRPGQRNCAFFMKNGKCTFEHRCVFNHPAETPNDILPHQISSNSSNVEGQSSSSTAHDSSIPTAAATAAGPPAPSRRAAVAGPVRPGQPRCITMLMRGICTMGPNCPYDHTPDTRSPSPSPVQANTGPAAAAAATRPQTEEHHPALSASRGASAVAEASVAAAAAAAAAAGHASSVPRGVLSPRTPEQERQLQELMAKYIQHQGKTTSKQSQGTFAFPKTGTTADGYPSRPGAANCTFYMYSGECKFKANCIYHHPDNVAHPIRFITTGAMSRKWPADEPAPYSRLVMFIDRIWDYRSCCECQLKTWLALHLLAEANPHCSMWDASAAEFAVAGADEWSVGDQAAAAAAGLKPLGPYSCSLSEAGILLHKLWSEQPDPAAAAQPMPYHKRVRELFATDPYFEVAPDPNNPSHLHVRLNVGRVKEMLNW